MQKGTSDSTWTGTPPSVQTIAHQKMIRIAMSRVDVPFSLLSLNLIHH